MACAFVMELPNSDVYHLDYFCVHPGFRGGGIGSKFFNGMVDFFKQEHKYPFLTLESETNLVPYYTNKLHCIDPHVQSDTFEDHHYYLLYTPLSSSCTTCAHTFPLQSNDCSICEEGWESQQGFEASMHKVVLDLKGVLQLAALFTQLDDTELGFDICQ